MPDRTQPERHSERHESTSQHAASAQASHRMLAELHADRQTPQSPATRRPPQLDASMNQELERERRGAHGSLRFISQHAGLHPDYSDAHRQNWYHLSDRGSGFDGDYVVQRGDTLESIGRREVERRHGTWNDNYEHQIEGMSDLYGNPVLPGMHINLRLLE